MDIEKKLLSLNEFRSFNPLQKAALGKKIFEKNIVISAPTASGKTVIAELCALNTIINKKKKVIYTCPLKALASEHYSEFKRRYSKPLHIRVALSTGDFDSSSKYLSNYDLIFATNEKVDSLIRHRAQWLSRVGLLVADEIHELDSDRGATLEMVISKLSSIVPSLQIAALSATIPNAAEIAEWLSAELIESDFRPVELREGILLNSTLYFDSLQNELRIGKEQVQALIEDTLEKKKQALFFLNTRRNAEGFAKKHSNTVGKRLSEKEKDFLLRVAQRVESVLEIPTQQCRKLASLVRKGTAFHHAGLLPKQRQIVEDAFRGGKIKLVSATPTLAAGINTPAFRVVIPSLYRYTAYGMQRIPVREYKQMAGRAGRPRFDSSGESIIVARNDLEEEELRDSYINGEIEPVESRLSFEPVLRMHLLALIASRFVFDSASMEKFFSRTFYASQYSSLGPLLEKLEELTSELVELEFVRESGGKLAATALGQRVSDLYLDPLSAHKIISALQKKLKEFGALYCLTDTSEFMPCLSVPKKSETELWESLQLRESELPIDLQREQFFDSSLLSKFRSALMLEDWINEKSESEIMEQYSVQPGILFSKRRICDWLAYSAIELSKLLQREENIPVMYKMRKRLKHGVREELLPLTELRGIGRVRARRLWRAGLRSAAALKKAPFSELFRVLGQETALKVKRQIGGKRVSSGRNPNKRKPREEQSSLGGFG